MTNNGYNITEEDIKATLRYLKTNVDENATREDAVQYLEEHKSLAHIAAHKIVDDELSAHSIKVLVIGASSYVGARIYFDLQKKYDTVGTYYSNPLSSKFKKLDTTNKDEVHKLIASEQPEVIVHVANHASSRPAQQDEAQYIEVNLNSAKHIIEAASNKDIKLIFISSFAALNPSDIYGKLKLESETLFEKSGNDFLILRPSLIVGYSPNIENDRPFNRILKCIDSKNVVEFDTSWVFSPTYVGHLSQLIDQAILENAWNVTLPVVIDTKVTQYKIALDILNHFDVEVQGIDKGYTIPSIEVDVGALDQFELSPKTYEEMIETIVAEIRNRGKFKLD